MEKYVYFSYVSYTDVFCDFIYSENFLKMLTCVLLFYTTGTSRPMKIGSKVPPKI